ncbi:MAG: glycosyltransferase [Sphingobacteriaceae bacterium]|nr:glycosyltransferase [Sphingobacteriaceae bacterium]
MAETLSTLDPQNLLAVLVTYGSSPVDTASWLSLQASEAGQQLQWLVFDNSATPASMLPKGVHYEHHPENPGVSTAYLRAANLAVELGKDWLLLLDQDSVFDSDWFEGYARAVAQYPNQKLFAPLVKQASVVLSPAPLRWGRAWTSTKSPPTVFSLRAFAPINAGLLLHVGAYQQTGGHPPEVALDFSDTAFLYFFRQHYPEGVLVKSSIQHRLSGVEKATYEQRLARFKLYCRDGLAFCRIGGPKVAVLGWMLWRSLLLGVRYRRVGFFWVFSRALYTH